MIRELNRHAQLHPRHRNINATQPPHPTPATRFHPRPDFHLSTSALLSAVPSTLPPHSVLHNPAPPNPANRTPPPKILRTTNPLRPIPEHPRANTSVYSVALPEVPSRAHIHLNTGICGPRGGCAEDTGAGDRGGNGGREGAEEVDECE